MIWQPGVCFLSTRRVSCEHFDLIFSLFLYGHRLLWSSSFKFAKLSLTVILYCFIRVVLCLPVWLCTPYMSGDFGSQKGVTDPLNWRHIRLQGTVWSGSRILVLWRSSQYYSLMNHLFSTPTLINFLLRHSSSLWMSLWALEYRCILPLLGRTFFPWRLDLVVDNVTEFLCDSTDNLSSTLVSCWGRVLEFLGAVVTCVSFIQLSEWVF